MKRKRLRTKRAAERRRLMKKLHDVRRRRRRCINNETHGRAYRGGRCRDCWSTKLAQERATYLERGRRAR